MQQPKSSFEEGRITRPSLCLLSLAALSAVILLVAVISQGFAEWFNTTVGAATRALLSYLTYLLPFSLAELLIFSLPLVAVGLVLYIWRRVGDSWRRYGIFFVNFLAVMSILFSLFVFSFGTGYHTRPLHDRMGLAKREVTATELLAAAEILVTRTNLAAEQIHFGEDGFSVMPYDRDEMNKRLLEAYLPICEDYPFVQRLHSRIKPVLASRLMSYTHITGVYSYFTGEANLNTHFPDYTLPFTAAHELAHQRGIARENEANFIAFLVTSRSEDPYLSYAGNLNLLEYVASALYRADKEAYDRVIDSLDGRVRGELAAYADFFSTFADSAAADASGAINDAYLKLQGSKEGSASYGLVVELAVSYLLP